MRTETQDVVRSPGRYLGVRSAPPVIATPPGPLGSPQPGGACACEGTCPIAGTHEPRWSACKRTRERGRGERAACRGATYPSRRAATPSASRDDAGGGQARATSKGVISSLALLVRDSSLPCDDARAWVGAEHGDDFPHAHDHLPPAPCASDARSAIGASGGEAHHVSAPSERPCARAVAGRAGSTAPFILS